MFNRHKPRPRKARTRRLRLLAFFCLTIGTLCGWVSAQAPPPAAEKEAFNKGVLIRMEGPIGPFLHAYVQRKLAEARAMEADLIILEIESPGGTVDESFAISNMMKDTGWARTVAYVPDYAISGAAIVSIGCDDIVMGPTARIGDAGVIRMGAGNFWRYAEEKVTSDVVRQIRDIAEEQGRPPAIAEAMVDKNLEVFRVTDNRTGKDTYMSQADIDASPDKGAFTRHELLQPSRKGVFLELNGKQAVKTGLAQAVILSRDELSDRYGLKQPMVVLKSGWTDLCIYLLNTTLVSFLLISVGLIALYIECSAPGIGVGGLIAGLCFALFFWSHFLGGTAGWLEVVLFVGGAIFIAMELFVIPGFGVAGVTGILLMLAGVLLASQDFVFPTQTADISVFTTNLGMLLAVFVTLVVGGIVATRYYGQLPVLGSMVLKPPVYDEDATAAGASLLTAEEKADGKAPPVPIEDAVQVGDWGVAESPLRPAGKVIINGVYADVVTDGSFVDKGTQVKVIKVTGNLITVREVPPEAAS